MADYSKLRKTAETLIAKSGKPVSFSRLTKGSFDPLTGDTSGDILGGTSGFGVMLRYKNSEIDGTTILSSDKKMIYSGEAPVINDTYLDWRIKRVEPLDPDESGALFYTLQLRK